MEVALQRRLAIRTRPKTQLEAAYGEWLTKNRQIAARFEGRVAQKRAAIAQLDKAIRSLAAESEMENRQLKAKRMEEAEGKGRICNSYFGRWLVYLVHYLLHIVNLFPLSHYTPSLPPRYFSLPLGFIS